MHVNWDIGSRHHLDVLEASDAMRSKISFTKEFRMAMALLEIPVSGCTCLSTEKERGILKPNTQWLDATWTHTFVDVGRVSLLSRLFALPLLVRI